MSRNKHYIHYSVIFLIALFLVTTSCSRRVYYSSERVYKARKGQDKRLKRKGNSKQHYRKNPRKAAAWKKRREFSKRKHSYGGVKKFGK